MVGSRSRSLGFGSSGITASWTGSGGGTNDDSQPSGRSVFEGGGTTGFSASGFHAGGAAGAGAFSFASPVAGFSNGFETTLD